MNKEYISYGIVGVVAGLVLGFIVANSVGSTGGGAAPTTSSASSEPKAASVNSSNTGQALPPGHPAIDTGQTIPAPPLPAGTPGASDAGSASSADLTGTSAELPSLDPLPASSKEERAEQKYKNIQLLRGIPSERLLKVMFAFKSSLGVDCTYCHIKDQFEKDDKPQKQTARKMIQLVRDTNAKLGGTARVTCFTCHRGQTRPAQ
jgi:Photosynthetic reaction centre cytochrome C subunit